MTELFDDMSLVASELVTNALRYGLTLDTEDSSNGTGRSACLDPEWPVQLTLLRKDAHVVCAVKDPSNQIPIQKEPDYLAETGRGLHLVESLSHEWGCTLRSEGGKVVWALFSPQP